MSKKEPATPEIVSFNEELVTFDAGDLSVSELERRFELAVAIPIWDSACGVLDCADVKCNPLTCGEFSSCGTDTVK